MDMGELAFYTNQELINELMRRKTFLGVVVHAEDELRQQGWRGEKIFRVQFNANLERETASGLLDVIAERMLLLNED